MLTIKILTTNHSLLQNVQFFILLCFFLLSPNPNVIDAKFPGVKAMLKNITNFIKHYVKKLFKTMQPGHNIIKNNTICVLQLLALGSISSIKR